MGNPINNFLYTPEHDHSQLVRRPLTEQQQKVFNLLKVGWRPPEISKRTRISESTVRDMMVKIKFNGYSWED